VIVAGEASGDMHAAGLVDAIRSFNPLVTFSGLGGELMQKNGVELYANLTRHAVVGFWEAFKHLSFFKQNFDLILEKITETRALAVILVDYPGFNLRLAREIKRRGIKTKIIYYISPQVWAWKESRVELIKKIVDKMLVILPFEKEFYAHRGMDVEFVGHPLLDQVKATKAPEAVLSSLGLLEKSRDTIALLPGSRQKEIERLLPAMLAAARILFKDNSLLQFILIKAPTVDQGLIERHLGTIPFPLKVVGQDRYNALNAVEFCVVASGTATLETAILGKPMVIVYKTSLLTWSLAKGLIRLPSIGLVNVIAGKKIVPECIQFEATAQKVASQIQSLYADQAKIQTIKEELKKVKAALGSPGASRRAAQVVLEVIQRKVGTAPTFPDNAFSDRK